MGMRPALQRQGEQHPHRAPRRGHRPDPGLPRQQGEAPHGAGDLPGRQVGEGAHRHRYRDFTLDGVSVSAEEDLEAFYNKFVETRVRGVRVGAKCTIMMYGPTGSGKSHTMFGCPKQPGIVYRALRDILGEGGEDNCPGVDNGGFGVGLFVQVAVLEIYNEEIYDLLSGYNGGGANGGLPKGNTPKARLEIMGKKAKNATYISGNEAGKISKEVAKVEKRRIVKSTLCNERSSRSHCLVYEYITYEMQKHASIACLPGMQERTIITSSLSKTFRVTGWRIGWAIAPCNIAYAIRNIHARITDSAPAPFQEAALTALSCQPSYFESLRKDYEARRDYVIEMLVMFGFQVHFKPQGSFFVFAELPQNWLSSDVDFVENLIKKAGIAAVPGCGFFHTPTNGRQYQNKYVRFAFCKSMATLTAAAEKISGLVSSTDGVILRK